MSDVVRSLLPSLPLPLAHLARRALNAKSSVERHNCTYYLGEAALKLAASARIGCYLAHGLQPGSALAQQLEALALPPIGHWCGFLRDVSATLSALPIPTPFQGERLELMRPDHEAAAAFAQRCEQLSVISREVRRAATNRGVVGFFELLAAYRSEVLGHGSQRSNTFYMPGNNPDNFETGDWFYNFYIWDYEKIVYWWTVYQMEWPDWDDGWGYWDCLNPDKPLARLFHAMYALQYSAPVGASSSTPLGWGFGYAVTEGEEPIPDCVKDGATATAKNVLGDEWIQLHYPFFYGDYYVPERAAILIHEARHLDGGCHHDGGSSCPHQGTCDSAWDAGCLRWFTWVPGANQFEIVWLWDFFKNAVNTTTPMKHRAVAWANEVLAGRFVYDPCFRIGPDGKAYQLPLPACHHTTGSTDYGTGTAVQPLEFQGSKCLTDTTPTVRSEACSTPPGSAQEWWLQPVRSGLDPRADGAVRIVLGSGFCLRVDAAPSWVLMPSGLECERVPWQTTLSRSTTCNDRQSEST